MNRVIGVEQDLPSVTRDLLKARFDFVRKELNESLDHVSEEALGWAPRDGMPTVRDLLFEIAGTEVAILAYIRDGTRMSLKQATAEWGDIRSVESVRKLLEEVRAESFAYLDTLSEARLEAPFHFPPGWIESLGLPEVPLREGFSGLAAHEWYHVGQLVSYLWARGEEPMKW